MSTFLTQEFIQSQLKKGRSQGEITSFLKTKGIDPTKANQEFQAPEGLLSSLAKGVIKPFAEAGVTAFRTAQAIPEVFKTVQAFRKGDQEAFRKQLAKTQKITGEPEVDLPFLGKVAPIASTAQAVGIGAEIGSFFIGGSGIKNLIQPTLKGLIAQGVKEGAKFGLAAGGIGGAGIGLQEEGATVGSIAESAVTGVVTGVVAGGVLGGGAPVLSRFFRGGGDVFSRLRRTVKGSQVAQSQAVRELGLETGETFLQRGIRRTKEKISGFQERRAFKKSQSPEVQALLNANVDPIDTLQIVRMSKADKQVGRRMLSIAQKSKAGDIQAKVVIEPGRTVLERVKFIQKSRIRTGAKLGRLVQTFDDTSKDFSTVTSKFLDDLPRVKVGEKGKLDFSKSRLAGLKLSPERKQLQNTFNFLRKNSDDLGSIHTFRQQLFDDLQLAKQQKVFTSNTERVLGNVRRELAEIFPNSYKKINTSFAEQTGAISSFFDIIGKKWKGTSDDILALRIGEIGQGIKSKTSSAPKLKILEMLDDVASKNGFKSNNSIIDQFWFAGFLSDNLSRAKTKALGGQAGKALSTLGEFAEGRPFRATSKLIGGALGIPGLPTEQELVAAILGVLK